MVFANAKCPHYAERNQILAIFELFGRCNNMLKLTNYLRYSGDVTRIHNKPTTLSSISLATLLTLSVRALSLSHGHKSRIYFK